MPAATAMEVVVPGEEIDPAELNLDSWATIRQRQRAYQHTKSESSRMSPSNNAPGRNGARNRPTRRGPPASPLPEEDIKIILRPRGGLDLGSVPQATLADAIFKEACLTQNPIDQMRVHRTPNYLLISTPAEERAQKYASIQSLNIKDRRYEMAAHVSAPANTVAGVIFNIPEDDSPEEIFRSVTNYNPEMQILAAKRLGTSNMAQILFNGTRVPFWVRYRAATYRCKPFKRKTEACTACWQPGHRQDVCPNAKPPSRCNACGTPNAAKDHQCLPKCIVCDGPHLTGSVDCPRRFQPRRRPQTYAQAAIEGHNHLDTKTSQQERPKKTENKQKDSGHQTQNTLNTSNQKQDNFQQQKKAPSLQPPNKQQGSDKVSSPSASSHCSPQTVQKVAPIPPELVKELANIKAEIALLRQENQTLRQENKMLKSQLENRNPQEDLDTNPPASKRRAVGDSPQNSVEEPM